MKVYDGLKIFIFVIIFPKSLDKEEVNFQYMRILAIGFLKILGKDLTYCTFNIFRVHKSLPTQMLLFIVTTCRLVNPSGNM